MAKNVNPGRTAQKASKPTSIGADKASKPAPIIDANLKARYQAELERFRQARSGEMASWDETYESLDAILYSDPPLYLAGGFKTARGFLAEYLPGVAEATVRDYIRVARH